jgi:molecular chaperone DnaJ
MKKDYYLILRLAPEATAQEIRSAYRRLAIELHPDISGFCSDPFLELQEAYSVLSDPIRRAAYDREAQKIPIRRADAAQPPEVVIRRRHSAEPLTRLRPMGGFETISPLGSFEAFHSPFGEMFDYLWSNFDFVTKPKTERPEILTVDVPLSARQALMGGQMRIFVPVRVICPWCRGRGHVGSYQCSRCEGYGEFRDEYPMTVSYPAGLRQNYLLRLPLESIGIEDFYLTIRFRPPEAIWWGTP